MGRIAALIYRLGAVILLGWALGFVWFALTLPRPAPARHTDAVIALTGGTGRIQHAIEVLRAGQAEHMLVAGVDSEVRSEEFARHYGVSAALLACCITLGYESVDTRSNAMEATRWIVARRIRSVRLVTTDWHMRRAAFDLAVVAPHGLVIVEDAVPSHPSFRMLFVEYNKYCARLIAWLAGWKG